MRFAFGFCGIFMRDGCVIEDPQNIALGQYLVIIQCQQERLANCEGGHSAIIVSFCHIASLSKTVNPTAKTAPRTNFYQASTISLIVD